MPNREGLWNISILLHRETGSLSNYEEAHHNQLISPFIYGSNKRKDIFYKAVQLMPNNKRT